MNENYLLKLIFAFLLINLHDEFNRLIIWSENTEADIAEEEGAISIIEL